jgi:hypothetical protein
MRGMSIDAARAFNRTCPPGTVVEFALRDGTARTGKLRCPAIVWAGLRHRQADLRLVGLPAPPVITAPARAP